MIKKILIVLLLIAVVAGICGLIHLWKVAHKNRTELAQYKTATSYSANLGKVLVIYYSWTGHTEDIAQQIAALTQADTYRIQTQEVFESSPAFYAKIKKQLADKNYPALQGSLPDVSQYDVIFVGAPVWWYTVSTPMLAFLQQMDFKGKKVIPFSTQGSNPGTFEADFARQARHAQVDAYMGFNNVGKQYEQAVHNKVITWLNNL